MAEARWIASHLARYPKDRLSPFLNLGSSTAEFREVNQPHIDREIFSPLRAAGVSVVHSDLKAAPGVDVSGDFTDPAVQSSLRELQPRAALSSNLLEHVHEPTKFAHAIRALLEPGALLLVTVPRSYPYHADPIDTGFRPSPDELASLFPATRLLHGEVVPDTSYARELWSRGPRRAAKALVGALRPRGSSARTQRDALRWLHRPFTISCILLEAV